MSEPFIAEVRIFAGNFAPRGWAFCNGQLLPIAQNTALFSLVGTTYGGDGRTTFGLPDLQGRAPMHPGRGPGLTSRTLGQGGGTDTVQLSASQMPVHTHTPRATSDTALEESPTGKTWAQNKTEPLYRNAGDLNTDLNSTAIENSGAGSSHNNMQPYLTLNYIIAIQGTYPSRS